MYKKVLIDVGARSGVKYWIDTTGQMINSETGRVVGGRIKGGYRLVCVNGVWKPLHRYVAETFCVKPDGATEVNHIDGNKLNNSADNLEWVTHKQNMEHAVKHGLWKTRFNENAYRADLTNDEVHTICKWIAEGKGFRKKLLPCTKHQFFNIKYKRSWSNISDLYF